MLGSEYIDDLVGILYDVDGYAYDGAYSGRGMYDKGCHAVVVDDLNRGLFLLGLYVGGLIDDDMIEALSRFSVDNLGRSYVIYFPKLAYESETENV